MNSSLDTSDLETTDVENNPRRRSKPSWLEETVSTSRTGDDDIRVPKKKRVTLDHGSSSKACPDVLPSPVDVSEQTSESNDDLMSRRTSQSEEVSQKLHAAVSENQLLLKANNLLLKKVLGRICMNMEAGDTDSIAEFNLPMACTDDFASNEAILKERVKAKCLISYLLTLGGMSVKNTIERVMTCLMTNKLAANFNWSGRRGIKKGLSKFRLSTVIKEACKKHGISEAESELAVRAWLKNAEDRDGGRQRRAQRQKEKASQRASAIKTLLAVDSSEDEVE